MTDIAKCMLADTIRKEILNVDALEAGTEEKTRAVEDLVKLYKLKIDESGTEVHSERNKNRYFKLGVDLAGILLPLVCYGFWMKQGFKFEETGTFTSATFKGLINRFKPTR